LVGTATTASIVVGTGKHDEVKARREMFVSWK